MRNLDVRLKPSNRHILVVPHFRNQESTSPVLVPDDFKDDTPRYIEATVIDVAEDCDKQFKHLKYGNLSESTKIIIDSTMLQKLELKDRTHYVILQNYVIGTYRRTGEI